MRLRSWVASVAQQWHAGERLAAPPDARRVCQAWHRANRVQVPMSGKGEAED